MATPHIRDFLQAHAVNIFYGLHLLNKGSNTFLLCIGRGDSLHLVSLEQAGAVHSRALNNLTALEQYSCVSVSGDTVCLFNPQQAKLSLVSIADDYSIKSLGSFTVDMRKIAPDAYVMSNPGFPALSLQYPYVYLRYGLRSAKKYIDSTAYVKYNINTGSYDKIIRYPSCFNNCSVYDYNSNIAVTNKGVYCLFKWHDDVLAYQPGGTLPAAEKRLQHDCRLKPFDMSRQSNLAYVRKYVATSESNNQLLADRSNNIFISKQLQREDLQSPLVNEFFVFDKDLRQINNFKSPAPVYPYAFFNYQQGFLFFNDSLSKAFYYEMEKL